MLLATRAFTGNVEKSSPSIPGTCSRACPRQEAALSCVVRACCLHLQPRGFQYWAPRPSCSCTSDEGYMKILTVGFSVTATGVIEKLCFSHLDYDTELKSTAATDKYKTCELPDGKRHHSWRQTSPVCGSAVPARLHWHRSQRLPRHFSSIARSATLTPSRRHSPVSRCQLARTERMTKELTVLAPFTVQLMVVAPPESLRPVSGSSFSLLVVLFPVFIWCHSDPSTRSMLHITCGPRPSACL